MKTADFRIGNSLKDLGGVVFWGSVVCLLGSVIFILSLIGILLHYGAVVSGFAWGIGKFLALNFGLEIIILGLFISAMIWGS